jgi:PKD repeat protein
MRNIRVSKPKIVIHLFFLLVIFYFCRDEVSATTILNTFENNKPIAVITADVLNGDAPLQVSFSGKNSSDYIGIVRYYWEFPCDSSSSLSPTYIFNKPGVYDITLMVTDDTNLTATAKLAITVTRGSGDNTGATCITNGGQSNDTGLKTWCWQDITLPTLSNSTGGIFQNGELKLNSECNENAITIVDDRIHFFVDPINPPASNNSACTRDYNMRAEVVTSPWQVRHPLGTEEWFGFNYGFDDDYIIDTATNWGLFQVHGGVWDEDPHIAIQVTKDNQQGHDAGEIVIVKDTNTVNNEYYFTGITPVAGDKLDIVVHVIWDNGGNGVFEVWINGINVHSDLSCDTVTTVSPWGGNAKFGIYKWRWANANGVQASAAQGVTSVSTSMGALRIITRQPVDTEYLTDSYSLVDPGIN